MHRKPTRMYSVLQKHNRVCLQERGTAEHVTQAGVNVLAANKGEHIERSSIIRRKLVRPHALIDMRSLQK